MHTTSRLNHFVHDSTSKFDFLFDKHQKFVELCCPKIWMKNSDVSFRFIFNVKGKPGIVN